MKLREEIKDIAPTLAHWDQEEYQKVPAGYFDTLPDQVMDRIQQEEDLKPYFQSLPQQVMSKLQATSRPKVSIYKMLSVAAVFVLLITATILFQSKNDSATQELYVSHDETFEYLLDEIESIEIEDLLETNIITEQNISDLLSANSELNISDQSMQIIISELNDDQLYDLL